MTKIVYYGLGTTGSTKKQNKKNHLQLWSEIVTGNVNKRKKAITRKHQRINRLWAYTKESQPKFLLEVKDYLEFDI